MVWLGVSVRVRVDYIIVSAVELIVFTKSCKNQTVVQPYFKSIPMADLTSYTLQSCSYRKQGRPDSWGSRIHKQITGCTGLSRAFLPLRQRPSLCYFLSPLLSVSLSMGCHGETGMNTPLSLVTCFLLCLPFSVYFSSCFQVSPLITFSGSDDDLHMCLSVILCMSC